MSLRLETRAQDSATSAHRSPAATWRIAAAVARVEGRRLIRHPASVIGLVLAAALLVSLQMTLAPVLQRDVVLVAVASLPLAAGVSFAAHLAASRLHRDETLPLAIVAPASDLARTAGLLLALLWPALASAAWVALLMLAMAGVGGIGSPATGDVFALSGTVLLLGAFGVALGRWAPSAIAGAFAMPVVAITLFLTFASVESSTAERLLPWADWGGLRVGGMIEAWPRAPWVHLLYVTLAAGVFAGTAVLRDRRSLPEVAALLGCGVGTLLVAWHLLAVWDDPATIDDLVRNVRDPEHRLVCEQAVSVEVCLPPGYEGWRSRFGDLVLAASAQLPADARPEGLRVVPHLSDHLDLGRSLPADALVDLPPDVAAAVRPYSPGTDLVATDQEGSTGPGPGSIPVSLAQHRPGTIAGDGQRLDLALGVVAEATGFRDTVERRRLHLLGDLYHGGLSAAVDTETAQGWNLMDGCPPQLEAREVLTFALAAASDPVARKALAVELELRPYGWVEAGEPIFDDWFALPEGGVTGHVGDRARGITVLGARGIFSRGAGTLGLALADSSEVADLHDDWARWTHPSTPAEELVNALGLTSLPSPVELAAVAGIDDIIEFAPECR